MKAKKVLKELEANVEKFQEMYKEDKLLTHKVDEFAGCELR
jgi:hypothetical protein